MTRVCFTGGATMNVDVWGLTYQFDPQSCNALLTHWANLQQTGQIHQLAREQNEMYTHLVTEIEKTMLVAATQIMYIQCGSPNSAYQTTFYENECTATCYFDIIGGGVQIYETSCGDMCCKRVSKFCINELGELETIGTPAVTSNSGNCVAPTSYCFEGIEGVCTNPCERISADIK